ncbi:MAG: exosortase-associated EpsI family protein, partial [Planctomycetes bacterium]|nr:exosortase-associated EpsI family protein [Planctomycetota bacterium]
MHRIMLITAACAILIASGVVHGVWTDRWSDQSDLADAAKRLDRLPMTLGAWHGMDVEMDKDPNTDLAGMIARRYVHAKTGKAVTLFLACGRSGPVCTHTPDVCYAGSGYDVEK